MKTQDIKNLIMKWTVSKGVETYGYNICSLKEQYIENFRLKYGKKYFCSGGGYDMQGTVLALWLEDNYPNELLSLSKQDNEYYGLKKTDKGFSIDGAYGLSSMIAIAKAIGLEIKEVYEKQKLEGFRVTTKR